MKQTRVVLNVLSYTCINPVESKKQNYDFPLPYIIDENISLTHMNPFEQGQEYVPIVFWHVLIIGVQGFAAHSSTSTSEFSNQVFVFSRQHRNAFL